MRLPPQPSPSPDPPSRRRFASLALSLPLLLQQRRPASALLGLGEEPRVEATQPADFVCQAKLRDQDFAILRYVGRFANGTVFDARYAKDPLTVEVGNFYLPGFDQVL